MERRNFQGANRKHNSDLSVCHTAHTPTHTFRHAVKKKKTLGRKNKSHCQVGKVGQWFVRGWTENSPSASACWAAPQSTTSKASTTRTERERTEREQRERGREMEMWREECWEDELIQAEACWHVRSLCTVFCVCFYLQQTERAYEKCAVGLTHRVSVPKRKKKL